MQDEQNRRRSMSRRDVMRGAAVLGGAAATVGLVAPGSATAAPDPAPAKPAPAVLAGLDDWLGSLVQVAGVAANILPMLLLAKQGQATGPYQVGGVQFQMLDIGGGPDLYAHNVSGDDVGLCYTLTQSLPASNTSVYQQLGKNGLYKCQADLQAFTNGELFMAPSPTFTTSDGVPTRTLSFAVRALAIGALVQVVGGVKLSVTKDPATGSFTAEITATGTPKILRAQIEATCPDGSVVRAQWDSSTSPNRLNDQTVKLPLPVGVNLDPVVQLLELYVDLDAAGLDEVTADRRSRVIYL
ncbi:hypothetical protein AWW66_05015 [Micromonospora rosaria]|uniref:Tat pathway signal sequence domain protein n=1 Tax=Micromonospora rosaria TaxID=47874 RepID=A0A136PX04_9ACTN|nr:twin-arginine translocation signal domain-containing protein [Micromonospora rosaria]KXK63008.1 hypothetical protein AWW66_05015 [Micromonospora rosaria]